MTRTLNNAPWLLLGIVFATLVALVPAVAHANPSAFASSATTNNAASTSPAWLVAGQSTTTLTFDSYTQTLSGGRQSKADVAGLLVQFNGSSTSAILNLAVEYSQDGIDWYRNYAVDPNLIGTTTPLGIGSPFSISWKYATQVLGGVPGTGTSTAALLIPTPFRYTRIVASVSGANGAVWMQFVPIKEQP